MEKNHSWNKMFEMKISESNRHNFLNSKRVPCWGFFTRSRAPRELTMGIK